MGEYTEQLPFGGKLVVFQDAWKIEYYFAGPDLRYRGEFRLIPGGGIDDYIQAFQSAWLEYDHLRRVIPAGSEFSKLGPLNLHIRVGGYWDGVSLHQFTRMIKSEADLTEIVASFRHAKDRAAAIQIAIWGRRRLSD